MSPEAEVLRLRDALALAEERIAQLERELAGTDVWCAPRDWNLTPSEATVLGVLVHRRLATPGAILAAVYRDMARDEPDEKIVDVFICKIRQKLRRAGIAIETVRGMGWRLPPETRARLREGDRAEARAA